MAEFFAAEAWTPQPMPDESWIVSCCQHLHIMKCLAAAWSESLRKLMHRAPAC